MSVNELPTIEIGGDRRELGRQHGDAVAARLRGGHGRKQEKGKADESHR